MDYFIMRSDILTIFAIAVGIPPVSAYSDGFTYSPFVGISLGFIILTFLLWLCRMYYHSRLVARLNEQRAHQPNVIIVHAPPNRSQQNTYSDDPVPPYPSGPALPPPYPGYSGPPNATHSSSNPGAGPTPKVGDTGIANPGYYEDLPPAYSEAVERAGAQNKL